MAINRRFLRQILLTSLFLFGAASLLQAQSAGYSYVMENGEPRFMQRLAWNGGEYALRYEVLIERQENGNYINYRQESTTALFIDISLPPGEYRFRVIPYDILDRPGVGTQWAQIEVLRAMQPEILDTPGRYIESDNARIQAYEIDGKDIAPDAEIFFRGQNGEMVAPVDVDIAENGSVLLQFDRDKLKTGEYELIVKNPGGLETSVNVVVSEVERKGRIKPLKPVLFDIGVFFSPPILPLYGDVYSGQPLFVSVGANIGVGFKIPTGIHIGPELTAVYQINEVFDNTLDLGFNLLIKKWMRGERFALCFRLGAEVSPMAEGSLSDNLKSNVGASVFWRLYSILYAEAAIEHLNLFVDSHPNGFMRFRIGFGVQL